MSGHSKWSQIKHQKGAADAKRGQLFSKLAHQIMLATRAGGKEISANPKLRLAVEKAKVSHMPQENIERAIKRGTGERDQDQLKAVIYEAYGPEGIAILIEALTNNKNRTAQELKHILFKFKGKLAGEGSVKWLFERRGVIEIPLPQKLSEENLELLAIESGAKELWPNQKKLVVVTSPDLHRHIKGVLEEKKITDMTSYISFVPKEKKQLDEPTLNEATILLQHITSHPSVQKIYTNLTS